MQRNSTFRLISIGLAIVLLLAVFAQRPIRIALHLRAMSSAHSAIISSLETGGSIDQATTAQYQTNRCRLVELGYFEYETFMFPSEDGVKIHSKIWSAVRDRFPENQHVELGYPENDLEVWVRPDEMDQWRRVIKQLRQRLVDDA